MRTQTQLENHKLVTCRCGQRYILCTKSISTDLFNNNKTKKISPLPLWCKSYFCPNCSAKKRGHYRHRINDNLGDRTWRFITLTTINTYHNTKEQMTRINTDWNKMRTILKKKYGKFSYAKVLEVGEKGMVHLHILVDTYIPKMFLKRMWYKYCKAYKVDISRAKSHERVAYYITKYMTKITADENVNDLYYLTNRRRITFSRDMKNQPYTDVIYKLFVQDIYRNHSLISMLMSLVVDHEIDFYDFDFSNLPPPLKDYCENDFREIYKIINQKNPDPKKQKYYHQKNYYVEDFESK